MRFFRLHLYLSKLRYFNTIYKSFCFILMQKIYNRNPYNPETQSLPKSKKPSEKTVGISPNRKQLKYFDTFDTFSEMNTQNLLHSPNSSLFCASSSNFCSPNLYFSRSNASLHKNLSETNLKMVTDKIKFEENCFRFKLKVCSILKSISPSDQEVMQLQAASPDVFISECEHRLKNFITSTKRRLQEQTQKIERLESKLDETERELNFVKLKLKEEEDLTKILKVIKKKEIEQYHSIFQEKQKKIEEYQSFIQDQQRIIAQGSLRNKQNNNSLINSIQIGGRKLNLSVEFSPQKTKQETIDRNKGSTCLCCSIRSMKSVQKKEKIITKDEYRFKMKVLIDQWRKILYETVDYYEDRLKKQS